MEERTLYVRGLDQSTEDYEDVWDDTILNTAYDKALKLANEEVAKRIAMETNTKGGKSNSSKAKSTNAKVKKELHTPLNSKASPSKEVEWKPGMPCRAIYEEDGLEYEAFLVKIIDDEDCIVKFLGYENSEKVAISTLKPTLGNKERMLQVEMALGERDDDGFESQPASENIEISTDGDYSPAPVEKSSSRKKRGSHKAHRTGAEFDLGDLPPLPMPSMNMFRNMGSMDGTMPMPPPPPLVSLSERTDAEEQAISDMLLSWYMTGYYTGLYQGMKRPRESRRSYK